jgi:hypothetical protein
MLPEGGAADVDGRRSAIRAARSGGWRREQSRAEKNHCGDGANAHGVIEPSLLARPGGTTKTRWPDSTLPPPGLGGAGR